MWIKKEDGGEFQVAVGGKILKLDKLKAEVEDDEGKVGITSKITTK